MIKVFIHCNEINIDKIQSLVRRYSEWNKSDDFCTKSEEHIIKKIKLEKLTYNLILKIKRNFVSLVRVIFSIKL